MPVRSPKSATWLGERGDEAVVVERGRAQRAGERQQLLHRLRGERLDLLELGAQPGRDVERRRPARRSRIAVSAWLTSSCRSWAMRARSSSWARMTARPPSTRSSSRRASMRLKPAVRRSISRGALRRRGRALAGGGEVDALHRRAAGGSSGASRRLSSSELSSTALTTASAISSSRSPRSRRCAGRREQRGDERGRRRRAPR